MDTDTLILESNPMIHLTITSKIITYIDSNDDEQFELIYTMDIFSMGRKIITLNCSFDFVLYLTSYIEVLFLFAYFNDNSIGDFEENVSNNAEDPYYIKIKNTFNEIGGDCTLSIIEKCWGKEEVVFATRVTMVDLNYLKEIFYDISSAENGPEYCGYSYDLSNNLEIVYQCDEINEKINKYLSLCGHY